MTSGKAYLVATGIVVIKTDAASPRDAIENLKERIRRRGEHQGPDPVIGMSLVNALREGRLNFIVMDEARTELLCGEFQGVYENPVSRRLATSLRRQLTETLFYTTDPATA